MAYYDSILQLLLIAGSGLRNIEEARVLCRVAEGNSVYTRETQ
jgi:hypothetical protein